MKNGRMQCKDIDDLTILSFLWVRRGEWCNWYFGDDKDVSHAMPEDTPNNLRHAKMRMLIRKGFVDGCSCGCRGDFLITPKGLDYLIRNTEDVLEVMKNSKAIVSTMVKCYNGE